MRGGNDVEVNEMFDKVSGRYGAKHRLLEDLRCYIPAVDMRNMS